MHRIIENNFDESLPDLGKFNAVIYQVLRFIVSQTITKFRFVPSFRAFGTGRQLLQFIDVASATPALHEKFPEAMGAARFDQTIRLMNCWMWKRNCAGLEKLVLPMQIVIGSGGNWLY